MIVTVILTLVVTIIAVMFALANTQSVHIVFFGYAMDSQVGLVMLVAFAVGIVLGILLMLPSVIGRSLAVARQRRKIYELEVQPKESKPKEEPKTPTPAA